MSRILSVRDIVVYKGQRMRVSAYVSGSRVRLVSLHGKPVRMEVSTGDKRIQKITTVRSVYESEIDESEIEGDENGNPATELDQRGEIE